MFNFYNYVGEKREWPLLDDEQGMYVSQGILEPGLKRQAPLPPAYTDESNVT